MTLEEVRTLVLSFPEVTEEHRRDGVIYRVRRAFFTRPVGQDGRFLLAHVPYEERELLTDLDPETYGSDQNHRVLLVRISSAEPDTLRRLLEYGWRAGASRRAQRAYDAGR